jgi:hypothetical protein
LAYQGEIRNEGLHALPGELRVGHPTVDAASMRLAPRCSAVSLTCWAIVYPPVWSPISFCNG